MTYKRASRGHTISQSTLEPTETSHSVRRCPQSRTKYLNSNGNQPRHAGESQWYKHIPSPSTRLTGNIAQSMDILRQYIQAYYEHTVSYGALESEAASEYVVKSAIKFFSCTTYRIDRDDTHSTASRLGHGFATSRSNQQVSSSRASSNDQLLLGSCFHCGFHLPCYGH